MRPQTSSLVTLKIFSDVADESLVSLVCQELNEISFITSRRVFLQQIPINYSLDFHILFFPLPVNLLPHINLVI